MRDLGLLRSNFESGCSDEVMQTEAAMVKDGHANSGRHYEIMKLRMNSPDMRKQMNKAYLYMNSKAAV